MFIQDYSEYKDTIFHLKNALFFIVLNSTLCSIIYYFNKITYDASKFDPNLYTTGNNSFIFFLWFIYIIGVPLMTYFILTLRNKNTNIKATLIYAFTIFLALYIFNPAIMIENVNFNDEFITFLINIYLIELFLSINFKNLSSHKVDKMSQ